MAQRYGLLPEASCYPDTCRHLGTMTLGPRSWPPFRLLRCMALPPSETRMRTQGKYLKGVPEASPFPPSWPPPQSGD